MKKLAVCGMAAVMSLTFAMTSFAGEWVQDKSKPENVDGISNWWYKNDDGTYPAGEWKWIDGDGNGLAESYRFNENGWMYASTVVDGYVVGSSGAWVQDGVIQYTRVEIPKTESTSKAYQSQWVENEHGKQYVDMNGKPFIGWKKISKKKYYFDDAGYAVTGLQEIDGTEYYFLSDGQLSQNTVHARDEGVYYVVEKETYSVLDIVDDSDWSEYRRNADRDTVDVSDVKSEGNYSYSASRVLSEEGHNERFAQECFDLINAERTKRGLKALTYNEDVYAACQARAEELIYQFAHERPDGRSCFTALAEAGLESYRTVGENIAAGQRTPEAAVKSWMNSSGHKANILNGNFTEGAIGCYVDPESEYTIYWVQLFYTPA